MSPEAPSQSQQADQVLYRKWRPQSFGEVVGQEAVTRTLRNSVSSGRLAHAYLLTGPRGTGKTSLGRLIAKAANCASPVEGEPCNECDSCKAFLEGRAVDFVEQDAASHNSVEDVRQLRENVALTPMAGERKVYLLDEVHMLSKGAENALLKTLEEPPPHIIFVLATTEPHRVESTIISRCLRFDLRRIPTSAVAERLAFVCQQEGFTLDEASLQEVARSASGSLRDAINGLEQIVTYYGRTPTPEQVREALGTSVDARSAELARLALIGELTEGLKLVAAVRDDGVDMRRFCTEVVGYLRGLLLVKSGAGETLDQPKEVIAEMESLAAGAEAEEIVRALKTLGRVEFRDDPQSSLPLELALVELASVGRGRGPDLREGVGERERAGGRSPSTGSGRADEAAAPRPSTGSGRTEAEAAEAGRGRGPDLREGADQAEAVEPRPSTGSGRAEDEPRPSGASRQRADTAGRGGESSAAGGDGLLERVREACKESDKQLSALLNASCEVKSLEGEVLTLGFYHTFHLERMEAGGYAGRLGELASAELGRTVRVELVHAPRRRDPGKVKGGHLVEAAKELGLTTDSEAKE